MSKHEEIIVLDTSDEAAKLVTVTGWLSRDGRFYGNDERLARFAGATHKTCECGEVHNIRGYCNNCRNKKMDAKYAAMQRVEWDGSSPLVIFDSDTYFFDADELAEYCDEHDCKPSELRLCHCKPNFARLMESDYWEDILTEDGDIPDALEAALNNLNDVIAKCPPLSWSQGDTAAIVSDSL